MSDPVACSATAHIGLVGGQLSAVAAVATCTTTRLLTPPPPTAPRTRHDAKAHEERAADTPHTRGSQNSISAERKALNLSDDADADSVGGPRRNRNCNREARGVALRCTLSAIASRVCVCAGSAER